MNPSGQAVTELVTIAATSANTIGSHGHPVLEEGNLSYPAGKYIVGFEGRRGESGFELVHRVEDAALVSNLVGAGCARYGCIVSSPRSFFREIRLTDDSRQNISWDDADLGEPPLFTPVVFCARTVEVTLNAARHGVHRAWDGVTVVLKKGARLAMGHVFDLRSSVLQLIRIETDDDQKGNSFRVEAESEPFRFVVRAAPALHRHLRAAPADRTRKNVLTHIVTACFALLQRRFADDREGWDRNLERLADLIEAKYPYCWDEDEFRPEAAATALYPHVLPTDVARL